MMVCLGVQGAGREHLEAGTEGAGKTWIGGLALLLRCLCAREQRNNLTTGLRNSFIK